MKPYLHAVYSNETKLVNTRMNEPIIREMLPDLKWNSQTQALDKVLVMGCEEYGRLMKHYGTRSWCENLPEYKVSKDSALKRFLRKPEHFERLEHSRIGKYFLPVYTFLSYDLLDLGPLFYIKLFYNNRRRKRK